MIAHLSIANLATLTASGSSGPPAYSWTGDDNPAFLISGSWANSQFFIYFSTDRPELSSSAFFLVQMIDPSGAVYREIEIAATRVLTGTFNYTVMFQLAAPSYPEYFTPRVTCRETNPVRSWPAVNGVAVYDQTP